MRSCLPSTAWASVTVPVGERRIRGGPGATANPGIRAVKPSLTWLPFPRGHHPPSHCGNGEMPVDIEPPNRRNPLHCLFPWGLPSVYLKQQI